MQPSREQKLWMYENMVLSRRCEEQIAKIYLEGKTPVFNMANGTIPGEMHLSDGQEPVAVGVCAHLDAQDVVTATHRPHHQAIAKGVDLDRMMAEIFGKATGLSGGRGGHMHLFDPAVNFGIGCSVERAVRDDEGNIALQPHVGLSLTFDHRAIDGGPAGAVLTDLCTTIETLE